MPRSDKAFTFVELLVTIIVFSVIVVSVFSALRLGIMAYKRSGEFSSGVQGLRMAVESFSRDLRSSYAYSPVESAFFSDEDSVEFFCLRRKASGANTGALEIAKVKYQLKDANLLRQLWFGRSAFSDDEGAEDMLIEGVSEFKVLFPFIGPGNEIEWLPGWQDPKQLPRAMKLSIALSRGNAEPVRMEKIITRPYGIFGLKDQARQHD